MPYINSKSKIGKNVSIAKNAIIFGNVEIGDNSKIADYSIIGEPLSYLKKEKQTPVTRIGDNANIRSHTVIYSGCSIGSNFQTGHFALVREYAEIGNYCSIGASTHLQPNVTLKDYCRIHSLCLLAEHTILNSFVFVYPQVTIANDPHPPSKYGKGAEVGKFTQIGAQSVLLPDIKIEEKCLIAAKSLVTKSFLTPNTFIKGHPAKDFGTTKQINSKYIEGSYYPWMEHYSKGMPWEKVGYDNWKKLEKN